MLERSLPGGDAPAEAQAAALRDWSQRLRVPLALDDVKGERIAASDSFLRRIAEGLRQAVRVQARRRPHALDHASGRVSPARRRPRAAATRRRPTTATGRMMPPPAPWPLLPPGMPRGTGLAIVLVVLFIAVAAGAFPVVRRLTRRLEALKRGVEQFGAGQLSHRVAISGSDEVAAVATSFNVAAARVEALVQSHRSLLANASHELRSPLARMKMAVSMLAEATPEQRETLKREIDRNVAELDGLVEEVLLASRLDAAESPLHRDPVDLLAVAAEEAARVGANVADPSEHAFVTGDERLLRRAVRNLLENGQRYGGGEVEVGVALAGTDAGRRVSVQVSDRGPGRPRGDARAHLRAVLPPAGPCRAGRRRRPRPGAGQADRRAPRRQRALRGARRAAAAAS